MGASESASMAWRVLDVLPNSPCEHLDLVPYFDFVVGCDGVRLSTLEEPFERIATDRRGDLITLTVFNYRTREKRDLSVRVGAEGIGLILVPCDFANADSYCIRITDVDVGGPVNTAALKGMSDYILGTPLEMFTSVDKFLEVVRDFEDEPLPLWVYRATTAEIWKTCVVPSTRWKGDGLLGCQIGSGFLHKLPALPRDESKVTLLLPPDSSKSDSPKVVGSKSPSGELVQKKTDIEAVASAQVCDTREDSMSSVKFPLPSSSKPETEHLSDDTMTSALKTESGKATDLRGAAVPTMAVPLYSGVPVS